MCGDKGRSCIRRFSLQRTRKQAASGPHAGRVTSSFICKSKIDAAAGTLPVAEASRLRPFWSADLDLTRSFLGLFPRACVRRVGPSTFLLLDQLLFGSAEHRYTAPETSTVRTPPEHVRGTGLRGTAAFGQSATERGLGAKATRRAIRAHVVAVLPGSVALLRARPRRRRL